MNSGSLLGPLFLFKGAIMQIQIPYSDYHIPVEIPEERISFIRNLPRTEPLPEWEKELSILLDKPTAGLSLKSILRPNVSVLILVEDQTRHTPVNRILPVLVSVWLRVERILPSGAISFTRPSQ